MRFSSLAGRALLTLSLAVVAAPLGAQQGEPLGAEVDRERALAEHERAMEEHRREMEHHRHEMERHARAMSEALMRAHAERGARYLPRSMPDSMHRGFLYRTNMSTPCARMGISFTGDDTILVREVMPGSGAAAAGVRAGDVIVTVDGDPADARRMSELSESMEPGDRIRLVVRRGERSETIDVTAREEVCPLHSMLSRAPFPVMCLSTDASGATADSACDRTMFLDLRRQLEDVRTMPLRMRTESTDSGTWMWFDGPDGGDSLFIDVDSVRALSGAFSVLADSIRGIMPAYTFELADSISRLMPKFDVEVHAADGARAHGLMLRSLELGSRALAGAQLQDLNPDLGAYFEAERGVLVVEVEPSTPAARAGLRAGDVIVSVAGVEVEGVRELRDAATGVEGDIELGIVRRGDRQTLRLPR